MTQIGEGFFICSLMIGHRSDSIADKNHVKTMLVSSQRILLNVHRTASLNVMFQFGLKSEQIYSGPINSN